MLRYGVIVIIVCILGCDSSDIKRRTNDVSDLKETTSSPIIRSVTPSSHHENTIDLGAEYRAKYFRYIDSIVSIFSAVDSTKKWDVKGEIIDSIFVGEGSGWTYELCGDLARYTYGQFGCSRNIKSIFYCINNTLVLHRDVETVYNAPLGYDKEEAHAKGDSADYGEPEIFEETSVFKDNKIIFQFSGDCGAPNARRYVESCEKDIIQRLEEMLLKLK